MQDFLNFIITNKRLILEVAILILSVVMFILRKKPVKFVDTMKQMMVEWLPSFILRAEKSGLKGEDKVIFVLKEMYEFFVPTHSFSYDYFLEIYEKYIRIHLEAILCTPQSHLMKGGNYGQKTKDEKKS